MTAPIQATVGSERLLSPLAAAMIVLVGVFAFAALVVLMAYAPDLRSADNGDAQALSRSAVGYGGIVEALKLSGDPVVVNRARVTPRSRASLMVVTPTFATSLEAVKGLRFSGPVLVVAPKWFAEPDPDHRGWVRKGFPIDSRLIPDTALIGKGAIVRRTGVSPATLHGVAAPFTSGERFESGPVDSLQSFKAPGFAPVLVDATGAAILSVDAGGRIFVLSDPDLINTAGLKNAATFATALGIVRGLKRGEGAVIFDVRLNGLGKQRGLLRLLFDPPFLAVTLCLAAAAALAGFQAACRFGPVRRTPRAIALGKQALIDNSAALIRLAGRETHMGGRYAALIRDLTARAVAAPRELAGDALIAFLDRLAAGRGAQDRLAQLTVLAQHPADRARLLDVAGRLYRFRLEMTRERT